MKHPRPTGADLYPALGRFMHQFGTTENHLAFMLQRYVSGIIDSLYEPFLAPGVGVIRPEPLMDLLRALIGVQ